MIPTSKGWTPAPAVRRALDEAADALRASGAEVERWDDAPDLEELVRMGIAILSSAGASPIRDLLAGDPPHALVKGELQMAGLPNAARAPLARLLRAFGQERAARLLPATYRRSAAGLFRILGDRFTLEAAFLSALDAGGYDAVLLPPTPIAAPRHRTTSAMVDAPHGSMAFNVLGMPSGVVAVTTVREGEESERAPSRDGAVRAVRENELGSVGLPVGVMVAARHWREDVVLAVMRAIEASVARPTLAPHNRSPVERVAR